MPSIPTHLMVGAALGQTAERRLRQNWKFWALAMACSALPDIDVLGFSFGIKYGEFWGHRGITHSILFALIIGIGAGWWLGGTRADRVWQSLLFFVITLSHGVLDAMTDGGLGVAFFLPFADGRFFFPWRPIFVSPLRASRFFTHRGLRIILNELVVVWVPMVVIGLVLYAWRRRREIAALNLD
jgi:inner membrane protein